ncbi:hypothetical protein AAFF_G00214350 [Aldrovandia affinis]|uniref:G-protein coupled receptors family 1 profile domain-containing protein n=1 Tax=Aldrovandia affinis TaxID=143900 RepID=A0AAD7W591_9TELE|nr:hypothetical protein AAFF_G00214350 [Aldrovandia affinis]
MTDILGIELLTFRFLISVVGIVGNIILIMSIFKIARLKTFEILLLGLAVSNLEGIIIVDVYDIIIIVSSSSLAMGNGSVCTTLKFLTVFGEVTTILFTMLISIFRYQKLRDAEKRVNLPVPMDSVPMVIGLSGSCVLLAFAFGAPTYIMNIDGHMTNHTGNTTCPPDFFQCPGGFCPTRNMIYKYSYLLLCILVPLCVVTVTSGHILKILLVQWRAVTPQTVGPAQSNFPRRKSSGFQRSTIAVLAAMAVFQVDWIVYLVLHLILDPYKFRSWSETEFFITTTYSTISPYVYGAGNNLFSLKHLCRAK